MTSAMLTEQRNPKSYRIDTLGTKEILSIINSEDEKVPSVVRDAISEIAATVDAITAAMKKGGRLFYIGAGTSGRLGVLDASECPPTYGVDPSLVQGIIAGGDEALRKSIEGAEDDRKKGAEDLLEKGFCKNDVVIGISANGGAPYVLGALKTARKLNAVAAAICCNRDSKAFELVEPCYRICIPVGPEIITGSTRMKAGTGQKLVLNMITTTVMIKLGKVYDNWMIDLLPVNQKLIKRSISMISQITGVDEKKAEDTFNESGNDIKVSIIMLLLSTTREHASMLLKSHDGNIHLIVDENKNQKGGSI